MLNLSVRPLLLTTAWLALIAPAAAAQDAPPVADPTAQPALRVTMQPTARPEVPPIPAVWAPVPVDDQGRSAYGLYLAGRLAMSRGQGDVGAAYLAEVERLTPEQPTVQTQAFTASLLSGDLTFAAGNTPMGDDVSPVIAQAGRLVEAVQQFQNGHAAEADAALAAQPIAMPHARAGALVAPWIAAAANDWTRALADPPVGLDTLGVLFARYHRALLFEIHGRAEQAEAEYKAVAELPAASPRFKLTYGEFLERAGRQAEAVALYDAAIAAGDQSVAVRTARQRAAGRLQPPALPTLREGAAMALTASAAAATNEGANEFAVVYLRLALGLNAQPEGVYLLGQTLANAKLEAAARAAFAEIPSSDRVIYAAGQLQIGLSLARDGQNEAALAAFDTAARIAPEDPQVAYVRAAQLVQLERYEEALALLDGPVLNTEDQAPDIHFMRGVVYESLDRIPEAEAELWAALQARPDDANTLNYLGYLWVDSGSRVTQGAELIARAHAAEPDNGNFQDSLGWSQYRQGQYDTAVVTLEEAVAKEPANAEINDHLGDAYWRTGREREAGFQWNRVLTLYPDAERRTEVERKINEGLAPSESAPSTPSSRP